jgi:excisionase family DNA binding protein
LLPQFRTAKEIADLLGVAEGWVMDHARAGNIPHYRFGRYYRFIEDEVLAWAESCQRGGRPVRFRRYDPTTSPRDAGTSGGVTPKE